MFRHCFYTLVVTTMLHGADEGRSLFETAGTPLPIVSPSANRIAGFIMSPTPERAELTPSNPQEKSPHKYLADYLSSEDEKDITPIQSCSSDSDDDGLVFGFE